MSQANETCPKCKGTMEAGVVPDRSYGAIIHASWFEGPAEKGMLGSLKLTGKKSFPITVYRCAACGYLESYARP
jgi:hypothetical protein